MLSIRSLAFASVSAIASIGVAAIAGPALAQEGDDGAKAEDIVVTGTLIRGIAPGGSQTIGVSLEKIEAVGAANTSDLLASVPAAGNFLSYVGVRGSSNFSLAVNRPSLRYLGSNGSSTASTLLLLDGHRMPGMGIVQTSPDLDAIAAGAIERVEIVTDGGSSTYGSDAVGGVINFITRKNFDGLEVKGGYGLGEDYQQANAAITAGKAWDGGSAWISYDYSWHTALFGEDRGWWQNLDWPLTAAAGSPVGADTNCATGNLVFGTRIYALPGKTLGNGNRCDNSELATFYPRETKHSALASISIDNGGAVSFQVKAFYVKRRSTSDAGPLTGTVSVPANSPFYIPVTGETGAESYRFNFSPVWGNSTPLVTRMEAFGITPSVKVDVGSNWQLNAMFNYGRGKASFEGAVNPNPNLVPINSGIAAGTFNPFNLGAAGNAAALVTARDLLQYARAINEITNARVVADGSLFTLPGGDVRVALGAEYMHEKWSGVTTRGATAATVAALTDTVVTRNIKSVFGEINVPVIGDGNRGFLHSVTVTASARYDDYSDFGGTFNPKIGLNIEPVDWLKLRGNWGKAFQAPGLYDIAQIGVPSINALSTSVRRFFDPATPVPAANHNQFILTVGGTLPGLKPQKANTWSLGFDIKPVGSSFAAGLTYYNIDFKDRIGNAPIQEPTFYALYANKAVLYPAGNAALSNYWNTLTAGAPPLAVATALATFGNFDNVYSVLDGRTTNLGRVKTSGLDFYVRYTHPTSFGDVYGDVSGNYVLTYSNGGTTGTLNTNALDPNNGFRVNTTLGSNIGNLRAQVSWAHTGGFRVLPSTANLQQVYAKGMDVFNLFFQYKVPGESAILKDLEFSLNIDNVFNVDPPLFRGLSNSLQGAGNGFTLGRVVKFGVSKKF